MKRILSLAAAALLCISAANAQASFGVGYMNPSHPATQDVLTGFYAGVDYNIPLAGNFGVAPGVYYNYGFKTTSNTLSLFGITAGGKATLAEQYIDVPVNFNIGLNLASDLTIRFYAGPTLSLGLSSTKKTEGNIAGITGSNVTDLYDISKYSKFDVLLGGGVAFDYAQQVRISLGYNYGMINRHSEKNPFHRNYLHMGVAYMF